MAYTTINKPSDYFNTVLYTGDGTTSQSITGVGFQPDWIWIKRRDSSANHRLTDVVRGVANHLESSNTDAEKGSSGIGSFDSDGWTFNATGAGFNGSGGTYVGWNWLADNTSGSSNSDGSITSTVSANITSGFSIVSYTGNGTDGATVGHGLNSTPQFSIIKRRSSTSNWDVTFEGITGGTSLNLDSNSAVFSPTQGYHQLGSTTLTLKDGASGDSRVNGNGDTYIAYCFHSVKGYSKFGSYTGNGSTDGTFVYTGFKPAFVMTKRTNTANDWEIQDSTRSNFNVCNEGLYPNLSSAEGTADRYDLLSNGIKMRTSSGMNQSGDTYIYMAFAENPFVTSTGIPATAR